MPENARCSPGGNAAISETDTSTTSTASTSGSTIRRRRKLRLPCRSQDWTGGITESHGENRRQHLHLQLRSCPLHYGKRVGAHGSLHHLRNRGDSVSWKEFQKIDGVCVDSTPINTAHTAQYSLFASVERIARAWLKNCITSLCAPKESVIWTCLTLCCSLTCRSPRAHLLSHSLFLLPRHQNTHYNRDNTIYSKNTQYIINPSKTFQSTSGAIKNHSGVKTCRVAETRAKNCPQVKDLEDDRSISVL